MKEFADSNFKVDENSRKFPKRAKNNVASNISYSKGVFKIPILQTCKKQSLFGKGLKLVPIGEAKFDPKAINIM